MYHARRNFILKGEQVKIGDPVNLCGLTRPESLIRGGFVEWRGKGKRDEIHREAFYEDFYPKAKRRRAKKSVFVPVESPDHMDAEGTRVIDGMTVESVSLTHLPSLFPVDPPKVVPLEFGKK